MAQNRIIDIAVWAPSHDPSKIAVLFSRTLQSRPTYHVTYKRYTTLVETLRATPGSFRPFWSGPGFVYTPKRPTDTDS